MSRKREAPSKSVPAEKAFVFSDKSILKACTIMAREETDLVSVIDRAQPMNVVGVVTGETVSCAIDEAESLR